MLRTLSVEIVFKLLARFNTQFRVKESFKLLLAIKVKNTSRYITKHFDNKKLSGPYSTLRFAKLTNHSVHTNWEI